MAEDVMVKDEPCNSCCQMWKEKCTKLKERCSKYENGRNALREAISILEQQITNFQAENLSLKKAYDDEMARADREKEDRGKESTMRVTLENEVSALKSEILLLRENGGLLGRDVDQEVPTLQVRISEAEKEIIQLKELLQGERKRVDEEKEKVEMERKKAKQALEKVKAEKKANEEKKLTDIQRKKDQEFRIQFETLKREADEAKSKLNLVTAKYEQENKKLKAEREISKKERECADTEKAKSEDLRKLAEANWKKAMDEKSCADQLSQQLDQKKERLDKLEKEFSKFISTRKLVEIPVSQSVEQGHGELAGEVGLGTMNRETNVPEACKKLKKLEKKVYRVKKQAKSEMKKAEEQMKVAEAYKSKALEEKNRADHLSCELEGNKQSLEKIRNEIQELVSSVKLIESLDPASGGSLQEAIAEIKLLRRQLKFEKLRVKHVKEVSKMEVDWNRILRQEVRRIKQDLIQFSQSFDVLDKCLFVKCEGINNLEKMESLNLEQECFHVQPSLMKSTEKEFVKPSCTSSMVTGGPGPVKQNKKCTVPLTPVCGEICTNPITGIDSSLELLLRDSNRKMLQTSAINSSSASFSDRPLVGSQERGTFSVTTSDLLAEEQNLEPTTSSLSNNSRKGYNGKLASGAEKSVQSPMKSCATERSGKHRKRKRLPDAVVPIENLYSAGQWHQQVLQKLSMLHSMLSCEFKEERFLAPKIQGNVCSELIRPHKKKKVSQMGLETVRPTELKMKLKTTCTEISEVCKNAFAIGGNRTAPELKDGEDDLSGNRWHLASDEVLNKDYMKLVDLDDDDEKHFCKAIEEPVSPLSTVLCNIQFPCAEAPEIEMHTFRSSQGFSTVQENVVPSCSFDVINVEIDSNEKTHEGLGTAKILSFGTSKSHNDSHKTLGNCGSIDSDIMCNGFSGQISRDKDLSCKNRFPQCCVVSSCMESSSIYRIFHVCSEIMSQVSVCCSIERLIGNILHSLQKADGLSPGERVSVFVSLLLHYIPEIKIGDFRSFSDLDFLLLRDSFAQQFCAVLNDAAMRRIFMESCDVGELLTLIEDFLLNKIILVHDDVSNRMEHDCDSKTKVLPNGNCIFWSTTEASTDLLFVGGLLLASICVSVDQIGFVCEVSYNLLGARKINISFLLRLLHVFASLCGPKYFILEDYGLEMYVLKSLVVFLERLNSSTGKFSCFPSVVEKSAKISACSMCPFLEDVASVDFVVSLLLEKLESYGLSGAEKQDSYKAISSNSVPAFPRMKNADIRCHREAVTLNFASNQNLCCFIDILSLVELVASFMTWDWTFGNIISRLLKMLDSYFPGNFFPAIITLLGQLGRIGVDAKGYEDSQVDSLRNWLVAFIHRSTFRSYDISVQFTSLTALIGLVARSFKEGIRNGFDSPVMASNSQSVAVDCFRNWFSSLNEQQQSSFRSLHFSSNWI